MPILLYVVGIAGAIGAWIATHVARKRRETSWAKLHELGRDRLTEGDPRAALLLLTEAFGIRAHHDTKRLIGFCFDLLGEPERAAHAYHDAWKCTLLPFSGRPNTLMAFYSWLEGSAWMTAGNWEFAFLRAREGLGCLKQCDPSAVAKKRELESELHTLSMIASLHHLHGSEAFQQAREDARWVVDNSIVQKHRDIASSLLDSLVAAGSVEFDLQHALQQYNQRN